jgi:hypothetical protein
MVANLAQATTVLHWCGDPQFKHLIEPLLPHCQHFAHISPMAKEIYEKFNPKISFISWPLCPESQYGFYSELTEEQVFTVPKEYDLIFIGKPLDSNRIQLLERAVQRYSSLYRVKTIGFTDQVNYAEVRDLYMKSRIGINIHNRSADAQWKDAIGNQRTFGLCVNGCMQICDNKKSLRYFYEEDEALGWDTEEELFALLDHYLACKQESEDIARKGFRRARRDYTAEAVFTTVIDTLKERGVKDSSIDNTSPLREEVPLGI